MQHVRNLAGATALASSPEFARSLGLDPADRQRIRQFTRDNLFTYDQATLDSAGAFLVGELERLDPTIHAPLYSTTWMRDIDLRTDVQAGDTTSSFTTSTFGATGSISTGAGIAWASALNTVLPRVQVDIAKVVNNLDIWAHEIGYTVAELEQARRTGRPIDEQQAVGLNIKHQMDIDQLVYVGDSAKGTTGLVNSSLITPSNVANNAAGTSTLWANKTYDEILTDINQMLISVWAATGYAVPPTKVLIAPVEYGLITTRLIGTSGYESILAYVKRNNILTAQRGIELDIQSCKWLDKAVLPGASTDRMIAYAQEQRYVRYPLVPLQALPVQYQGVHIKVPYWGRLGVVEWVYPETGAFRDGIG